MTISLFDQIFGSFFKNKPGLHKLLKEVSQEVKARRVIQKSRKQLLELDDDLLKDIGVTREQAMQEAKREFWD